MESLSLLLQDFHFIRPWWLLGLPALALYIVFTRNRGADRGLDELVDPHLVHVVVDDPGLAPRDRSQWVSALAIALSLLALAGPTWERIPQPLYQLQQGRVIVLNLNASMDRNDLQPGRLQRARFKIDDLMTSMPGILTGLVAFAGDAFVVAPLSDDRDTISNLLHSLESDTLPVQGIRADRGLQKAHELLQRVAIDRGEVILVTDQSSPLAVATAAELAAQGVRVSVLEVAPASDRSQTALLSSIAQSGRGISTKVSADNADIQRLNTPLKQWMAQSQSETAETRRNADQWYDLGPWLLIPVLLMVSFIFRRGWLLQAILLPVGIAGSVLILPQPAAAFDWSSLWENSRQQQWKAVQAYRNGDMTTAAQGFASDRSATGAYNRGNALAKSEQLPQALEAYDEALKLNPEFEDARYNRQLVEQALKQQQQQQQQQQQPSDESEQGEGEGEEPGEPSDEQNSNEEESERSDNENQGQDAPPRDQQPQGNESSQHPTDPEAESQQQDQETADDAGPQPENRSEQQVKEEQESSNSDTGAQAGETGPLDEDTQALELLLREVPDDPGALLKRKFKYQYQSRQP